ncbi:MAG: hypothetical protein JW798_03895 [Prolixibacteraceae bacterium]|nr:hypothetical protein [Prolixibacteraceae bacterium]
MKNKYFFLLFTLLIVPFSRAQDTIRYVETIDDVAIEVIKIVSSNDDKLEIELFAGQKEYFEKANNKFEANYFKIIDHDSKTNIELSRKENMIYALGVIKGEKIIEEYQIDERPWFGIIDISLEDFVRSNEEEYTFWVFDVNGHKMRKMVAHCEGVENITFQGEIISAHKVKVTLTGFAALFWKSYYWYRISDKRFVKYSGPVGKDASDTTVELLE